MSTSINLKRRLLTGFIVFHCFIIYGQKVYISEVFYDTPLHEYIFGSYTNFAGKEMFASNNGEYIELYNPGPNDVNISNWRLSGHFPVETFKFPNNSIIRAGSYAIVVYRHLKTPTFKISTALPELFNYEASGKIFYHNAIRLSNRGEKIRLYDSQDNMVDWMEYDGITAQGVSKPKPEAGEKPIYARNGSSGIEAFPQSLSLHRISVLRDPSGNAYFKRSNWKHNRITPLGITTNIPGLDFEQLPDIPSDFYTISSYNQNQPDLDYTQPDAQPASLSFQENDIIFDYDNAGNRILRTIYLRQSRAAKAKDNNEPTGVDVIKHKADKRDIRIYPNPTKGMLKVQVNGQDKDTTADVFIYSLNGSIILRKQKTGIDTNIEIDLSSQSPGVYILNLTIESESYSWKIIKE